MATATPALDAADTATRAEPQLLRFAIETVGAGMIEDPLDL